MAVVTVKVGRSDSMRNGWKCSRCGAVGLPEPRKALRDNRCDCPTSDSIDWWKIRQTDVRFLVDDHGLLDSVELGSWVDA